MLRNHLLARSGRSAWTGVRIGERGDRVDGWTLRRSYTTPWAAGLGHLREADPPLRRHDLRHTFASHAVTVMDALSDVQRS